MSELIDDIRILKVGERKMVEQDVWIEKLDNTGYRVDVKFPVEPQLQYVIYVWLQAVPDNIYVGAFGASEGAGYLSLQLKMIAQAYAAGFGTKLFVYIRDILNHTWCKPSGIPIDVQNAYPVEVDVRSGDLRA